jgi:hypothetical protein
LIEIKTDGHNQFFKRLAWNSKPWERKEIGKEEEKVFRAQLHLHCEHASYKSKEDDISL